MTWLLVSIVIISTVVTDLLQSHEMKRQGEVESINASSLKSLFLRLFQHWKLGVSIIGLAISFFALLALLQIADLSFAVPATAGGSIAVETVLAKFILKERINGKRWAGALLVAIGVALVAQA